MSSNLARLARGRPVLRESALLASICLLDMVTTLYWVRNHIATESNPLFVGPLAHSDAAFLILKGASFLIPVAVLEFLRPLRPELVVHALRVCLAGYVATYVLGSIGLRLIDLV